MEIYGRAEIYTDVGIITRDNVSDVVKKAMKIHEVNAKKIEFLLGYEAGNQPISRTKTYRKDIDCKCVDNVAHEIAKFHIVNYVQVEFCTTHNKNIFTNERR